MNEANLVLIPVHAEPDHLDNLARVGPLSAVCELVWNALDADATEVLIDVVENRLGGVEEVIIRDNGTGIPFEHAARVFGSLGGSWKRERRRTGVEGRLLHGREGKGRFRAFALGRIVTWHTVFGDPGQRQAYTLRGSRENLLTFTLTPPQPAGDAPTGTEVRVTGIESALGVLADGGPAWSQLSEHFALYLKDYPGVKICFRGDPISPSVAQRQFHEYTLADFTAADGRTYPVKLDVVEWNSRRERKLCLCNEAGVTLHHVEAGIRPGEDYNFTAYVRSALIDELHRSNRLMLDELDPVVEFIIEHARERLREHFRQKKSQLAIRLIHSWKAEGSYPFPDETEPVEEVPAHRRLFDRCAVLTHEHLDDFRRGDVQTRRLMLHVLHEMVRLQPARLPDLLGDLLGLPEDQLEELRNLATLPPAASPS